MPVDHTLRIDSASLAGLRNLEGAVRVSAAVALTKTAKDAQASLKGEAPGTFHLRNRWVVQGIRIDPADKGSLSAKVGSIDLYMGRHVVGEDKRPEHALSIRRQRDDRGRLATGGLLIAPYGAIGSAQTHRQTRSKLRRIDRQKKKTFQILGRGGAKVLLVRRKTNKRNPLQVLALLDDLAQPKPIWPMDKTVYGVVGARFGAHFKAALAVGASRGR